MAGRASNHRKSALINSDSCKCAKVHIIITIIVVVVVVKKKKKYVKFKQNNRLRSVAGSVKGRPIN